MPFLEGTKFGARNKIIMVPKSSFWGKLKSFMYDTQSKKGKYSFFPKYAGHVQNGK
jgi:hypothetical protein